MTEKIKKNILILTDIIILYTSLYLTLILRYGKDFNLEILKEHLFPFSIIYLIWIFIFYLFRLYDPHITKNNYTFYSTLSNALLFSTFIAIAIFYLYPNFSITPKTNMAINIVIFFVLFALWRQIYNKLISSKALLKNILFIGANKDAQELILILKTNPQLGYSVFETQSTSKEELEKIIKNKKINIIVHSKEPKTEESDLAGTLYSLLPLGITVYDLPKFYSEITKKIPVSIIGRTWFLENLLESEKGAYEIIKRILDFSLAILLSIITLPFFPIIMLIIFLEDKGNPFYTQTRMGKNGKIFKLLKFRTMIKDAEKFGAQWTKDGDLRITKIGNFLRKTRIDELPQLYNVFKGDMSFIGPRPERPEFVKNLEKHIPHYQMRHLIRPGLTGWAQINQPLGGASVKDSTEKLQYDLYYIKNRSLILDLDILAKTIMIVLKREGR